MVDPTGTSLINIGELAKPAVVLIEKVSDAVGGISKPWQIRRIASAEAKAEIIRAEARLQISELEERALRRMIKEEGKKQENIENITEKATSLLEDNAKPENVEDDWITHFFDKGRLVSDKEMQTIWGSMLAGEANSPGSFSKSTVDLVATLEKTDAHLFTRFCSFVWSFGDLAPLVFDFNKGEATEDPVTFSEAQHLMSLGLIHIGTGYSRLNIGKQLILSYYGKSLCLNFPQDKGNTLDIGTVLLSSAGAQLALICGSKPNKNHFMQVLNRWSEAGLSPSEPCATLENKMHRKWFS